MLKLGRPARANGGKEQRGAGRHGLLVKGQAGGGRVAGGRPGMKPQFVPRAVEVVQQADPGIEQRPPALREGGQQLLGFKLGDERVAQFHESSELLGISAEPFVLPQAVQHHARLGGIAGQSPEIGRSEGPGTVGIEIDRADRMSVHNERRGHFAKDTGAGRNIPRLGGNIRDEQGLAMQGNPAGDTLAGFQGEIPDFLRQALLLTDLQQAGIGVEQGQRTAVSGESGEDGSEDAALRGGRVGGAGCQRRERIEDRQVLWVIGAHLREMNRIGLDWGEKINQEPPRATPPV